MRRRLRQFAAVGAVVTVLDVALVLTLRLGLGLPVIAADALAITAAATASYLLNRWVTFNDDPHVRWVREPGTFVRVALAAGLLDVALLRLAVVPLDPDRVATLLAAKLLALTAAAALRLASYRRVLFHRVRSEQAAVRGDRPPPPGDVRFSVVLPAYQEEDRIGAAVTEVRRTLAEGGVEHEVVVVDDGSPDATAAAARAAGADQVIVLPENRGKGAAVRVGVLAARGRAVAFTDADLSYPPQQLARFLVEVEAGWDMVVGSRHHVDTTTLVRAGRLREVSGRVFNVLTLVVLLGQYRDTQSGIKAFRSDVARTLFARTRIDRFAFDVELFHLAERYRLTLREVPVEIANTQTSSVRVGADALRMIADLVRIRRLASSGAYAEPPH